MTEEGTAAPSDPHHDDMTGASSHLADRLSGDPSHDLFGHGWTPGTETPGSEQSRRSDSYTGRHRAPDAQQ